MRQNFDCFHHTISQVGTAQLQFFCSSLSCPLVSSTRTDPYIILSVMNKEAVSSQDSLNNINV